MKSDTYYPMSINADHYLDYRNQKFIDDFWLGKTPDWTCPHCNAGALKIDESMFIYQETDESLSEHNHKDWEPSWIEYHFIGTLTCIKCKDNTFFSGIGFVNENLIQETGGYERDTLFKPKYFLPSIALLKIPDSCPEVISKIIIESFSIAWSSFSGAGSLLRSSVEALMDDIAPDINKTLTLGSKIKLYLDRDEVNGELLNAVKWLGNTGSHEANLEEHDLASAYKMLELVLNNLYNSDSSEMIRIAKLINSKKGPIR